MPQFVDTPPPKPPRRRYSDQMSMSSLGAHFTDKKDENLLKNTSQESNIKPTFFSLPSSLTSNLLTKYDQSSSIEIDWLNTNESLTKSMNDKHKLKQNHVSQIIHGLDDKCENKKIHCNYQKFIMNHNSFAQNDQFSPRSVNQVKSTAVYNPLYLKNYVYQNFKTSNIYCHRRFHSDSAISYFKRPIESSSESSSDDILSCKHLKTCNYLCHCCKINYFIIKEVQFVKEINEKLWQHLCTVQNCLEALKKKPFKRPTEISLSSLLSSIYYAQKERESAMEERLKIALEERDSALLELEKIICILSMNFEKTEAEVIHFNGTTDKRTSDLLHEIGCAHNLSSLLSYQKTLLAHLCKLKFSKEGSLSYDLEYILVERNNALEKVKRLEEEIKGFKMCFDLWYLDNKHWELTLFDVLYQLIERENIATKTDKSLATTNINHRIPNFKQDFPEKNQLSQHETDFSHQWNKHLNTIDKSDKSKALQKEIVLLNASLDEEKRKREQAEKKCLRLERLIHAFRVKLDGQNIGVPV